MTTAKLMTNSDSVRVPNSDRDSHACEVSTFKQKYILNESESVRQVRMRSLSHWPHCTPTAQSMALAGWHSCNITDRVVCIYCDSICQQWTKADDPIEVHARLAPQCPFVLSISAVKTSPKIVNSTMTDKFKPSHSSMTNVSCRRATFSDPKWTDASPLVDDLVRAGFFFAGVSNTVTCFYCDGSLHQWGANDNPMIEHARWFPNCLYARHLCGDDLHEKVQVTKKQLTTEKKFNDQELNRLVAARLDLPEVQRLRSQYSLAVIKRCLEDQLKIKQDDFATDLDLAMACLILQKQIDVIKGCKEKIIVPSQHRQMVASLKTPQQPLGECLICLTDEKQLACMPCGHLCACVPCGYALRTCPVCRQTVQCFLRINA